MLITQSEKNNNSVPFKEKHNIFGFDVIAHSGAQFNKHTPLSSCRHGSFGVFLLSGLGIVSKYLEQLNKGFRTTPKQLKDYGILYIV